MSKNYAYNANFLEEWLRQKGMKKDEFQQRMGITAQSYYRWVEDKSNPMPVQHILKFCNMFDEDVSNFFTDGGESIELQVMPARQQKRRAVPASDTTNINLKEQILQMKLECAEKIQEIKDKAQEREDAIRAKAEEREKILEQKLEERVEEYRQMMKLMDTTHREGTDLVKKALDLSQTKGSGTNISEKYNARGKKGAKYELPEWPPTGVADEVQTPL